ncbi:Uncharacterized protein TCM_041095 [Theobroma cacao]|uniref:Uncharacterized protein n=1 Tax=Theobroma cacao TaxID=3641 RepID=A0A061GUD8_THECC|nr:Uncharacterized protein TCM_041095 [Theobroma cacao]
MIFLQSKLFFMLLIGMASLSGWSWEIGKICCCTCYGCDTHQCSNCCWAEAISLCDFLCGSFLLKANRCVSHIVPFLSIAVGRLAKHASALIMAGKSLIPDLSFRKEAMTQHVS